jgi:cytochrome c peroxidase
MRIPAAAALAALLLACTPEAVPPPAAPKAPVWPQLARFEPMRVPLDNPLTREKVALGRKLFNDPRLSADRSTSCSGCHEPKYGYTIGAARPIGAFGIEQNRACPSLINAGYAKGYYWEGAAVPLEKAITGVWKFILVPQGDGRPTIDDVAARLNEDVSLRAEFRAAFGKEANPDTVVQALASFVRTLVPTGAAWVRFHGGETSALSPAAQRGYEIFDAKARCTNCHAGILLTDRLRHDVGTGTGKPFKTPTLLNIGRSAPYFHDNRFPTLEEAVDRMLAGGFPTETPDPQLKPVTLTAEERGLLLAFLRELNADPASVDGSEL